MFRSIRSKRRLFVVALSLIGLVVLFYLFVLPPLVDFVFYYLPWEAPNQGCVRDVSWGFAAPYINECEALSQCEEYQDRGPEWKEDMCYFRVAGVTRNPEICILIDDQDQKEGCFTDVARILKKPLLCERIDRSSIPGQERYERCVENASVKGEGQQ